MDRFQLPEARKDRLVIQDLPEEILVYDLNTNKAHCLNETAAFVWKTCNGNNSVAEITKLFEKKSGDQISEDFIWLAIDQLNDKKLLKTGLDSRFNGKSRREAIKKIGMATVISLPVVTSRSHRQAS